MKKNNLFQTMYKLIAFAVPVSAGGLINMISSFISMMMVAVLGKQQLAAGALAIPAFFAFIAVTTTIFYAISILISHQKGQDKSPAEIGLIVRNGFWLALILSFPAALGLWQVDKLLGLVGQDPELVALTRGFFHVAALGMFPALINVVIAQFYAGTNRPHFTLWISVVSLPPTVILAYGLILGHFGFPEMGLTGIAFANLIVQSIVMFTMLLIIYWQEKTRNSPYRIFNKHFLPDWSVCNSIFTLGLPIGMQFGGELAAMIAASWLIGYFGSTALAASQIVAQYTMLVMVLIIGLTQALSILVSEGYGKKDYFQIKEYLKASLLTLIILCCFVSIIFLYIPKSLIQFYLGKDMIDKQLEYLSIAFFAINACFLLIDGTRHLLSGALRGLHDSRASMHIGIITLWCVSLPMSYFIGMICHTGPIGLRIGFVSGFIVAAALLAWRMYKKLEAGITFH